jgi:hypothetical protein
VQLRAVTARAPASPAIGVERSDVEGHTPFAMMWLSAFGQARERTRAHESASEPDDRLGLISARSAAEVAKNAADRRISWLTSARLPQRNPRLGAYGFSIVSRLRVLVALICALGLGLACVGAGNVRVADGAGLTFATPNPGTTCVIPMCEQSRAGNEIAVESSGAVASLDAPVGFSPTCVQSASCVGGGTLAVGSVIVLALFSCLTALGPSRPRPMRMRHRSAARFALPKAAVPPIFRPPRFI